MVILVTLFLQTLVSIPLYPHTCKYTHFVFLSKEQQKKYYWRERRKFGLVMQTDTVTFLFPSMPEYCTFLTNVIFFLLICINRNDDLSKSVYSYKISKPLYIAVKYAMIFIQTD